MLYVKCLFAVSQQEIVSLYQRFCQLDRSANGFISADEFMAVPEFAMNPLAQVLNLYFILFPYLCFQLCKLSTDNKYL